ncbi:hypothetical protein P691DRAFT_801160 [Macrolepiota fuliginosa MF-IS2]|uniref:Uncharacterized protein n=1 Tax=Macrolepiota fuliginosa MF-IS2 TaxID=1400762 RepID=A0A9P5XM40_9AGAR|nr:hypothetical protein P691DRAFT_801160 [Macrolepiota fuliginosa MF-IS2]
MTSRQALTSLRNAFSSSSSSCSRLVHSSAPNRATILQVSAVAPGEPEEITLAPIFDIFDVPSRLSESSDFIRSEPQVQRRPRDPEPSATDYSSTLPRPPPSTLPAPITFDGPARPRNRHLAFQRQVEQALSGAVPASTRQTRQHHTPSLPSSASEPLIEMFEGPARLTRYSHKSSSQHGVGYIIRTQTGVC